MSKPADPHPNRKYSILQNAKPSDIRNDPYPYVVIHDALPPDLAARLTGEFPLDQFDLSQNNKRCDIYSADVQNGKPIPQVWTEFVNYHHSRQFLGEVTGMFGDAIVRHYPETFPDRDHLSKLRAGVRNIDTFDNADVLIDAMISINTPVTREGSVRQAHLDNPDKLFTALYYLRRPENKTKGGNLQVCRWKDGYGLQKKLFVYQEGLDPRHFDVVEEVEYDNNVCLLFINSFEALHSVTPRTITNNIRTFATIIGEVDHDLFSKTAVYSRDRLKRKFHRFRKRVGLAG
jgi:hypothetical protein